jgi:hypothetical protein
MGGKRYSLSLKSWKSLTVSIKNIKSLIFYPLIRLASVRPKIFTGCSASEKNWFIAVSVLIAVVWKRGCSQHKQVTSNEDLVRFFFFLCI